MAQRRMLSRRISQSKKLNKLPLKAQLVWTWTIPYLDDYGCYTADPEDIKSEVFPKNKKISIKDIAVALQQEIGLVKLFQINGNAYQQYENFEDFQTLKIDRPKQCCHKDLENSGNQRKPLESTGSPKLSKEKLSKEKLSKKNYSDSFEIFWKNFKGRWSVDKGTYVKVGKFEAFEEWQKLTPDEQKHATAAADRAGGKYTPDACRWLKRKLFDDFKIKG